MIIMQQEAGEYNFYFLSMIFHNLNVFVLLLIVLINILLFFFCFFLGMVPRQAVPFVITFLSLIV